MENLQSLAGLLVSRPRRLSPQAKCLNMEKYGFPHFLQFLPVPRFFPFLPVLLYFSPVFTPFLPVFTGLKIDDIEAIGDVAKGIQF